MSTSRNYNYKDVDMILASKTVVQNFSDNIDELSVVRNNWTPDYAAELNTKIDGAIDSFIGLDKKKDLRNATALLSTIQVPAQHDLTFFKTQIEVDFKNDPTKKDNLLKSLGLGSDLRKIQNGDQEVLIETLVAFKKGMSDTVKSEITEKGINQAFIDRILDYANKLISAEVSQETLKDSTKILTSDAIELFNEIYDEVIGICKIASSYYQYDPLQKAKFTFSRIVNNMGAGKSINNAGSEAA